MDGLATNTLYLHHKKKRQRQKEERHVADS